MEGNEYRGMRDNNHSSLHQHRAHPKDKEEPVEEEELVYQITCKTAMTHTVRKWKTVQVKTGSIFHRSSKIIIYTTYEKENFHRPFPPHITEPYQNENCAHEEQQQDGYTCNRNNSRTVTHVIETTAGRLHM